MTSARFASPAARSTSLPVGRRANSPADDLLPSAGAFYSAEAFVSEWIGAPANIHINPPRPDYGPQYNGVGECPF